MGKILTASEVARILSVKVVTVYSLVQKKRIPYIKLSKKLLRFKEREIQKWIDGGRVTKVKF